MILKMSCESATFKLSRPRTSTCARVVIEWIKEPSKEKSMRLRKKVLFKVIERGNLDVKMFLLKETRIRY